MASQLNKYAQNIARARYATPAIPATGVRSSRARISVPSPSATGPAAKAPAAKVPTGVEPGEPTAPEYNPIIDAETMSPPVDPNRQEAIANQARMPRFAIGNPNVGNIDLGSLLSAKANPNYDPNAPVGGANVPFQETKGIGGFFRRMFGDTANEQNVAAQEQQKAEWKAEDTLAKRRAEKKEDLADEIRLRMEADRTLKKEDREFTADQNKAMREFTASQNNLDRTLRQGESQADRDTRVALAEKENNAAWRRLEAELGFRKGESAADRAFRSGESAADRALRSSEGAADRAARMAESEANRNLTAAHYGLIREDNAADRALRSSEGAANRAIEEARLGLQREGQAGEIQYRQRPRFERLGDNVYQNERGDVFEYSPGMMDFKTGKSAPGGFKKIPTQPIPKSVMGAGGAAQVDRATGLPIGEGVLRPGGSAAVMTNAAPVVTQPRSATLTDRALNALPFGSDILDMPRVMTPERTARLEETKRQQQAENLRRTRAMQEQAYGDLGPSMF